jgi:hypothetical protein
MNKFAYLVAASALVVSAFGQGSIDIGNRGLALVTSAAQPNGITGTSFVAQVWYGASAGALTKNFAPSPFRVATTSSPGTWNPAGVGGPGNAIQTLDGFAAGSTVTLQVAVWDSAVAGAGAASALAKAAGTGLSETFTYTIPTDPLAIPGGMGNMKTFALVAGGAPVIPEPTTVALGALGAAALLLRRRK